LELCLIFLRIGAISEDFSLAHQNPAQFFMMSAASILVPVASKHNHKEIFDTKLQELMAKKGKNATIPTSEKLEEIKRILKAGKPSKENPEGKKAFYELDNKFQVVTIMHKEHIMFKAGDPSKKRRRKGDNFGCDSPVSLHNQLSTRSTKYVPTCRMNQRK
jgi:hypothetical protein